MTVVPQLQLDREQIERDRRDIHNCLILAQLADENTANIPLLGLERKSITENVRGDALIYVQALSREPKLFQELGKNPKAIYIAFENRSQAFLRSIKYYEAENKIQYLRERLQNKLILIKPKLAERNDGNDLFHYNFEFVWVGDDVESSHYHPVPRIDPDLPWTRFESFLLDKNQPFRLNEYPNLMETPEFIVCEKYLYYIPNDSILTLNPQNRTVYYCRHPELIKKIEVPSSDWQTEFKSVRRDLSFITTEYAGNLRELLNENGVHLTPQSIAVTPDNRQSDTNATLSEEVPPSSVKEIDFIQHLKYLASVDNLVYEDADLINFHTALKTSVMPILGGMSGTGKSKLALLYAKALGLINNEHLLILPISPAYTEPSDILGYLNHQLGIYMESETGLVSFLQKAADHPEELFMVIFDEMNLGQVEHYFSPFISIMEMDDDDRLLTLFSDNAVCRDKSLKNRIHIGKNILFVGTANFDETTKDFSKRLLDRSNVIHLKKYDFKEAKSLHYEGEPPVITKPIDTNIYRKGWTSKQGGLKDLYDDELELLERMHELMANIDSQTGVSFRIVKGISTYLKNIPKDQHHADLLSRERAFDYQIKQRVLTKIRGHREQIESLVGSYDFQKNLYEPGEMATLLSDWAAEKYEMEKIKFSFDICRDYLIQKAKELSRNGYTL